MTIGAMPVGTMPIGAGFAPAIHRMKRAGLKTRHQTVRDGTLGFGFRGSPVRGTLA